MARHRRLHARTALASQIRGIEAGLDRIHLYRVAYFESGHLDHRFMTTPEYAPRTFRLGHCALDIDCLNRAVGTMNLDRLELLCVGGRIKAPVLNGLALDPRIGQYLHDARALIGADAAIGHGNVIGVEYNHVVGSIVSALSRRNLGS